MFDILFVTDFVCPYCLVAKVALEEALQELGIEAQIRMQPLELTREPKPRVDTCHDERRKENYKILVEPAKALGLDMKLPPNVCPRPYTRLAFEGWYYAQEQGCGDLYADMVYRAYFEKEQDLEDMSVLTGIAQKAGLDKDAFVKVLEDGVYTQQLKEAVDYSIDVLEVNTIPTIYINGEQLFLEHYTKEEFLEILQNGLEAMAEGGFACGIDGCE